MTTENNDEINWGAVLQIYGQHSWHGDAMIVGNSEGLRVLRDALNQAIAHPDGKAMPYAFPSDGEGYQVCITRHDRTAATWDTKLYPAEYIVMQDSDAAVATLGAEVVRLREMIRAQYQLLALAGQLSEAATVIEQAIGYPDPEQIAALYKAAQAFDAACLEYVGDGEGVHG